MINPFAIFVEGIPVVYSPGRDSWITLLVLGCFFISSYVLYRSRKFLLQLVKDFFLHKERTSIFASSTAADMRYLLLLVLQTCMLVALTLFDFMVDNSPGMVKSLPGIAWAGLLFGGSLLFVLLKWLIYTFAGWVFFDRVRVSMWIESYTTLLYYLGFSLFPFTLLTIYFDLSTNIYLSATIGLFVVFKLLTLFKWYKLFCNNFYCSLLLILYFCALEIIPYCIIFSGMIKLDYY